MIGSRLISDVIKKLYDENLATTACVVSNNSKDVYYTLAIHEKTGTGAVARTRRHSGDLYEFVMVSSIISDEKRDEYVSFVNDVLATSIDMAGENGGLVRIDDPVRFEYMHPNDQLIEDLDTFLEKIGYKKPFDDLYE